MKKILFILVMITAVFISNIILAQTDSNKADKNLKKAVKQKLIDKLSIDEITADKLMAAFQENRKAMNELRKKRKKLQDDIVENPKSPDVLKSIDELTELDYKEYTTKKDFIDKLKTFLTPEQIALSFAFQKNLMKFMKKEIKEKRPHKDGDQ